MDWDWEEGKLCLFEGSPNVDELHAVKTNFGIFVIVILKYELLGGASQMVSSPILFVSPYGFFHLLEKKRRTPLVKRIILRTLPSFGMTTTKI